MSPNRFGLIVYLLFAALTLPGTAQEPATPSDQPAAQSGQSNTATPQPASEETQKKPPVEPYIIEDGGFSLEPFYWLNRAQPTLRGGAAATAFGNLDYAGNANPSIGGQLGIPAGRSNTLRFSYFRTQGNANSTLTREATIFGEPYATGDYLSQSYTLQSAKLSWDYLSYTWYKPAGKIRLKTLYELQFTTISTNIDAPFKAATTDSSGNTDFNVAHGSKNLIYPTFGLELEQALGRYFRWEVKGSGFGVPHHATLWDAEGSIAIRLRQFEILGGEKAYHFKTSPQADQYFKDTLWGAYVGLRYYWGGEH